MTYVALWKAIFLQRREVEQFQKKFFKSSFCFVVVVVVVVVVFVLALRATNPDKDIRLTGILVTE